MMHRNELTSVSILAMVSIVLAIVLVACAPAAQPTPASAPAPVAKPAQPAAPTVGVAKQVPAAAPTPAAKPVQAAKPEAKAPAAAKTEPDWKVKWDSIVTAAKKEGKVVVSGPPGDTWRNATADFSKAYPEIKVDWQGFGGSDISPRILREQEAGLYLWDLAIVGIPVALGMMKDATPVVPLTQHLILPEVLDGSKWHQGFEFGWGDLKRQYIYSFLGYVMPMSLVNRDVGPEAEIRTLDDLLAPKWKGKIAIHDPRRPGPGQTGLHYLYVVQGDAWVRKLLAQNIAPIQDTRQMLESLIRGTYVAVMGQRNAEYLEFKKLGLTNRIAPVGSYLTSGSGAVTMMKNPPNPNAATVFLNWLLSKEGQEAFVRTTGNNSRRLDVKGPEETTPEPGVKYADTMKQDHDESRKVLVDLVSATLK